jgi:predicted DNA-binding transcriptional regulator AlpA
MERPSKFLTIEQLADWLSVRRTWIYDRNGEAAGPDRIPHFKFGKYVRFDPDSEEFKAWLQRNFKN